MLGVDIIEEVDRQQGHSGGVSATPVWERIDSIGPTNHELLFAA